LGTNNIKKPAVFLDRDGTLIFNRNYLKFPSMVKLYSCVAESINKLHTTGFKVIVVTNQSGIRRGLLTENELYKVNEKFLSILKSKNAKVDGLYYCPHIESDRCFCRKPKIGMVLQAANDFNIDLSKSYTVGDNIKDCLLGFNMGGKSILVLTGHGKKYQNNLINAKITTFIICKNFKQAVNFIIKDTKN
jgi:D,D-heptose 1,7-bisphosphate phosphatase